MESNDDRQAAEYPLGRGYGHDYMRGGEVFGGYGYSGRKEYERPRGEHTPDEGGAATAMDGVAEQSADVSGDGLIEIDALAEQLSNSPDVVNPGQSYAAALEHTFGSSGGSLRHSRSYYVTQAQLQQRVYKNNSTERANKDSTPN